MNTAHNTEYFTQEIIGAVTKALGLPVSGCAFENGNEIKLVIDIEGPGAESSFWRAVLETVKDDES